MAPVGVSQLADSVRSQLSVARSIARRSHRFNWFAWGTIIAGIGGLLVWVILTFLYPVIATTTLSTSYLTPLWAYLFAVGPAAVVFGFAIREVFVGRRESRAPAPQLGEDAFDADGWTRQAVEAGVFLFTAKHETDEALFPLALALVGMGGFVGFCVIHAIPGAFGAYPDLVEAAASIAALLLLLPLGRVVRDWIGRYQAELDRQVRAVSELEAEFLWRFTTPPGPSA